MNMTHVIRMKPMNDNMGDSQSARTTRTQVAELCDACWWTMHASQTYRDTTILLLRMCGLIDQLDPTILDRLPPVSKEERNEFAALMRGRYNNV